MLIVDDHEGFRSWLRTFVEEIGGVVVGEACTGAEAIVQADLLSPHVVLLDIQLPDTSGFAVADQLDASLADPEIVFVSSRAVSAYDPNSVKTRRFISKENLCQDNLEAALGLAR